MANFEDIITQNEKAFEGSNHKESFTALSAKLNELGYDVLINNKKEAEFVPSSRMHEVVSQRDNFKGQLEQANINLNALKDGARGNDALQGELQKMVDQNNQLLKDLETTKIRTALLVSAKDAIDAQDLLAFVNMSNIKLKANGDILGAEEEINRLRKEKPYLFSVSGEQRRKGGMDNGGAGGAEAPKGGMNAMIRRAAGLS